MLLEHNREGMDANLAAERGTGIDFACCTKHWSRVVWSLRIFMLARTGKLTLQIIVSSFPVCGACFCLDLTIYRKMNGRTTERQRQNAVNDPRYIPRYYKDTF